MTRTLKEITEELLKGNYVPVYTEIIRSIADLGKSSNDIRIAIFYHADLDGNASCYMIDRFIKECAEVLHFNNDIIIERIEINYSYSTNRFNSLDNYDTVFLLDYSLSNAEHMKWFTNCTCPLFWIDHHESSIIMYDDYNKGISKDYITKFFDKNNLQHLLYTEKGCSAAYLCAIVSGICIDNIRMYLNNTYSDNIFVIIDKTNNFYNTIPEIIKLVSLYDTFHPESKREFYYGINTVDYSFTSAGDETYNTWRSLDNSTDFWLLPNDNINNMIEDMLYKGSVIFEYQKHSNKIYQRGVLFTVDILIESDDNDKVYHAAVMNGKGNSYIFEDYYDEYDCVILFYLNNKGFYNYSIYSNSDKFDVNCREIAEFFDGGGHKGAAGFTSNLNIFNIIFKEGMFTKYKDHNALKLLKFD